MKNIKYMGCECKVPEWAKFIATDLDGEIYAFEFRPKRDENGWWTKFHRPPKGRARLVGDCGRGAIWSWKDSLVELEE